MCILHVSVGFNHPCKLFTGNPTPTTPQTNKNWPAIANANTSTITAYLCVNLYSAASDTRYSTAARASCDAIVSTTSGVSGGDCEFCGVRPVDPTVTLRKLMATMEIIPTTAPQIPSKNAERNCWGGGGW
jgi:hypothetical protein